MAPQGLSQAVQSSTSTPYRGSIIGTQSQLNQANSSVVSPHSGKTAGESTQKTEGDESKVSEQIIRLRAIQLQFKLDAFPNCSSTQPTQVNSQPGAGKSVANGAPESKKTSGTSQQPRVRQPVTETSGRKMKEPASPTVQSKQVREHNRQRNAQNPQETRPALFAAGQGQAHQLSVQEKLQQVLKSRPGLHAELKSTQSTQQPHYLNLQPPQYPYSHRQPHDRSSPGGLTGTPPRYPANPGPDAGMMQQSIKNQPPIDRLFTQFQVNTQHAIQSQKINTDLHQGLQAMTASLYACFCQFEQNQQTTISECNELLDSFSSQKPGAGYELPLWDDYDLGKIFEKDNLQFLEQKWIDLKQRHEQRFQLVTAARESAKNTIQNIERQMGQQWGQEQTELVNVFSVFLEQQYEKYSLIQQTQQKKLEQVKEWVKAECQPFFQMDDNENRQTSDELVSDNKQFWQEQDQLHQQRLQSHHPNANSLFQKLLTHAEQLKQIYLKPIYPQPEAQIEYMGVGNRLVEMTKIGDQLFKTVGTQRFTVIENQVFEMKDNQLFTVLGDEPFNVLIGQASSQQAGTKQFPLPKQAQGSHLNNPSVQTVPGSSEVLGRKRKLDQIQVDRNSGADSTQSASTSTTTTATTTTTSGTGENVSGNPTKRARISKSAATQQQ